MKNNLIADLNSAISFMLKYYKIEYGYPGAFPNFLLSFLNFVFLGIGKIDLSTKHVIVPKETLS